MKIKDTFVLRSIAGSSIVVPTGAEMMDFNGMITLNETGAFLWEKMQSETDIASLADAMLAEYTGISREDAEADIKEFIATLDAKGIIENG